MKSYYFVWMIFCICLFFIGCENNEQPVEAIETTSSTEGNHTQIEETSEKEENDFSVKLENQEYLLSFDSFPILTRYIENFENPQQKLENLTYIPLLDDQFLVEFACNGKACSYLILDFHNQSSYLLSDLSTFVSKQQASNFHYASFLFERTSVEGVKKHHLVIMDLYTLEPTLLEITDEDTLIPRPAQFQYSIRSVTFLEDQKIEIVSEDHLSNSKKDIVTTWKYQTP